MSMQTDPPQGLRERKKLKLRRAIQAEALRLFEIQGYEQTTVEQIAEAAETSTTTFYRYFPTKEDVVLDDDFDALIAVTIASRPADESLSDTLRATASVVGAASEADREQNIARLRLMSTVPAVDARYAAEERRTISLLSGLLADRAGRPADDYQITLIAAALVAVLFTAARRWASEHGATPLGTLLDEAITIIDPLLTGF
jgi:AcrR family transcriptional regulator